MRPAPPYVIVGLGLVGGSLARAWKRELPAGTEIWAVEPNTDVRVAALAEAVVDRAFGAVEPELAQAGLVVLATPLGALQATLARLKVVLPESTVITDVIGVKTAVEAAVALYLPRNPFVGGHPMAGGEAGGFDKSRADLFVDRTVVLCPSPDKIVTEDIARLWRTVGARPVFLSPSEHDRVVATTSHLPYLAALSLVRLADAEEHGVGLVAGRGFADATRRADFAPGIMAAAVSENTFVPRALRGLAAELTRLAELVERDPKALEGEAERARALHRALVASVKQQTRT